MLADQGVIAGMESHATVSYCVEEMNLPIRVSESF